MTLEQIAIVLVSILCVGYLYGIIIYVPEKVERESTNLDWNDGCCEICNKKWDIDHISNYPESIHVSCSICGFSTIVYDHNKRRYKLALDELRHRKARRGGLYE